MSSLCARGLDMPPLNSPLACLVCKSGPVRFRIEALNTKHVAHVCSVKCLLTWGLNYSLGSVQGIVQKLLKGVPK